MRRLIAVLPLFFTVMPAETLEEAVRALGRRVESRLASADRVSIQTRGLPPVGAGERERVERGMRESLGRRLAPAGASAQLRVTISAAMARRVLVAEFARGDESTIMMTEYEPGDAAARPVRARPMLERAMLWEQDERILDAAAGAENGEFWVLDTDGAVLRNRQGEVMRDLRVRRNGEPWPRDVRGRLVVAGAEPRVWLPGKPAGAWPVARGFEALPSGENEFAAGTARFFTAARVSESALVLAGVDGRLRWSEGGSAREFEGQWGSEVAALANPCGDGAGAVLLVSSRDGLSLGVYEPRTMRPAGEGMTLPGTLSALWPAEGETSAMAVVRTPAGRYAA